jgi:hypothetical protein
MTFTLFSDTAKLNLNESSAPQVSFPMLWEAWWERDDWMNSQ